MTTLNLILETHPVSWEEYARAIHLVLNGLGKGIDVDFKSRNLVGVGHSMGASAMSVYHDRLFMVYYILITFHRRSVLTRTIFPFVSWSTTILIEPMIVHRNNFTGKNQFLLKGALKRRDMWSSREEAQEFLRERSLKSWDPRVVDIYVVCMKF